MEVATTADIDQMAALHFLSHTVSFKPFASAEFVATRRIESYVAIYREFLGNPDPEARAWVARHAGRVIGIVGVYPMAEVGLAQLGGMHVHPDHQGRGVGRALMGAAEEFIRSAGYRRCVLGVVLANSRARRLYEGLGWSKAEEHPSGVEGVPYAVYEKRFD